MLNNPENFCFWLQGFFELSGGNTLTPEQVQIIKDHLALVFNKVTPTYVYPTLGTLPDPFKEPSPFPETICQLNTDSVSKINDLSGQVPNDDIYYC